MTDHTFICCGCDAPIAPNAGARYKGTDGTFLCSGCEYGTGAPVTHDLWLGLTGQRLWTQEDELAVTGAFGWPE